MMNLNERQQRNARTLDVGEVIVRSASGFPVLVQVPHYEGTLERTPTADDDVKTFMQGQIARLRLSIPQSEPWQPEAVEPPAATATAQHPGQQPLTGANRRNRIVGLPPTVVSHPLEVLLVGLPANIAFVVIANEDAAVLGALVVRLPLH